VEASYKKNWEYIKKYYIQQWTCQS